MSTPTAAADPGTQRFQWVHEPDPRWDADRERVFATVPAGVFRAVVGPDGERLPGDWWRVVEGDRVIGYGWLDDVWGDAEVLLAVEEASRGTGAGRFLLDRLEDEAAARGLNYVMNVVPDTHPDRVAVTAWFRAHGFTGSEDGQLRKQVGDRARDIGQHQEGRPGTEHTGEEPADPRRARYEAERDRAVGRRGSGPEETAATAASAPMGPGHEEAGGYVDPEEHRY